VPPGADGIRLLLVDDEPLVGKACAQALGRAGFEVSTASDAREALA
jgi:DNA-binding response OmpR family regulator